MSLRTRLLIVAALAGLALGIAFATVWRLTDASRSLGLDEAAKSDQAALARLAMTVPTRETARELARQAVGPVPETRGGYCWSDGTIVEEMAAAFGDHPPGPPPRGGGPPAPIRAAIERLCATGGTIDLDFHGVTHLEVMRMDGVSAFAMRAVPVAETRGSPWLVALAALTIAIVAIALLSLTSLRRERDLERQVAHQKRMASLGALVAGISHEIRNPLTGVKLMLDAIGRDGHREEVDLALREVSRLDKLVVSCLGVARETEITRVEIDLGKLVDERIAVADGHVTRTGGGMRAWDREALTRILDNLIRNAREVSADVEVIIDGSTIDVVDRGPGAPDARTLFEPFVTTKADGTGLGLWMSLALAEARGGTIRYRRADGRTHFTLSLEGT